jgi:tyrosine-specific transport protein
MVPAWISALMFTLIFGFIVYFGIRTVDYVNRVLMLIKFIAYFTLVLLLMPFISSNKLAFEGFKSLASVTAITVTITSFGYATIVPTLRVYFAGNIKKLKIAIFTGSLIPLVCYIIWDMVIMGIIPIHGQNGLIAILQSDSSTSEMVNTLDNMMSSGIVTLSVKFFTSICVLTSFLGVALCLTDFLADGLRMEKKGKENVIIQLVTFLPPLMIVLYFPDVFIQALQYAGIYCIILLMLFPAWMAWRGRYHQHIAKGYQVRGGKPLLFVIIIFSLVTIVWGLVG